MATDEEQEILVEKADAESGPSILSIYYREIGRFPVLNRDEEQRLGRQAAAGVAAARERLILCHLRLVVKIAQEYADTGVPILDLIQEGNVGLIEGVDRFDPERGYRLSTYAAWWIRRAILASISTYTRMVRIPDYLFRAVRQMAQIRALGEGEAPDDSEILTAANLSADRLRQIERQVGEIASLDRPVAGEDDASLDERLEDDSGLSPEREALRLLFREELDDVLAKLPARQAFAIRLHYGLEDGCPYSLADVGRIMDVSRERARQLVKEGMDHLVDRWGERALDAYRTLLKE